MHSPGGGFLRVRGDDAARNAVRTLPPLPFPAPIPRCLLPRRLSFDAICAQRKAARRQRVRRFACRRIPFSWSLAVHHQSLAFRARLCHAKNEALISHRLLPPLFAFFQHQGVLFPSIVYRAKYYNHFVSLTSKNFNNLSHKFRKVFM